MIRPELLQLLNSRCDVVLATRSAQHVPSVCWGMACRVEAGGGHGPGSPALPRTTVWLRRDQAAALLADISQNGQVAASFSVPFTSVCFQLKGRNATWREAMPTDLPILQEHLHNLIREIELVGFPEAFTRHAFEQPLDLLVAVSFSVTEVFEQTPGPHAGHTVEARA